MFRTLIAAALAAFFVGCATPAAQSTQGEKTIRVQGHGDTLKAARDRAFRQAIETQIGVAVVSEFESADQNLTKEGVLHYSSGYILRYKTISETSTPGNSSVVLEVTVVDSKIANRILYDGKNTQRDQIDGASITAKIDSSAQERAGAHALVGNTLDTFARDAIIVEQRGSYLYRWDHVQQSGQITIPVVIRWNENYIRALIETFNRTHIRDPYANHGLTISTGWFGAQHYAGISEDQYNRLWTLVTEPRRAGRNLHAPRGDIWDRPSSQVSLIDASGKTVWWGCFHPSLDGLFTTSWNQKTMYLSYDIITYKTEQSKNSEFYIPVQRGDKVYTALQQAVQIRFERGCPNVRR